MPSPFGDCKSSEGYVQSECLAECEANYVISNCSCKDVYMPGEINLIFSDDLWQTERDEQTVPHCSGFIHKYSDCGPQINQIKSNMTLIMVDKPQPSYNLLNVMK